jgi:hypothetical protein
MAETENDLGAYVAQAAQLMGIDLGCTDPAAVAANLRNYRMLYEAVRGTGEEETKEPAAVYRP